MSGPLLVGAEGVLLIADNDNYGASRPLMEGLELITQMRHHPTTRTTVTVGVVDTSMPEHYMKIHGLNGVNVKGILPEDRDEDPALAQWYVIERCRSAGPINLVITSYSLVWQKCVATHQPVLLYGRRGSLGEGQEVRATWDELHAKVLRHQDAEADMIEDEGL